MEVEDVDAGLKEFGESFKTVAAKLDKGDDLATMAAEMGFDVTAYRAKLNRARTKAAKVQQALNKRNFM